MSEETMTTTMTKHCDEQRRQRVYNVLWDWTVLRVSHDGLASVDERLELVRTLHRLASSAQHVMALFRIWRTEPDVRVQMTLSWACFQFLSSKPVGRSQAILRGSQSLLLQLLQDPCPTRRVVCCEMVYKLNNIGFVPENVLASLDASVVDILEAYHPLRCERAVEAVLRYLTLRPPTVAGPSMDRCLPCGGMAWRVVMEYLAFREAAWLPLTAAARFIAPVPSKYETRYVVGTLSQKAQTAFVTMASAIPFADGVGVNEDGPTLYLLMDALHNCFKAADALPGVVPQTVRILNAMGEQLGAEYHVRLWDTGWGILETVMSYPRSAARAAPYLPEIFGLLRRLPQAHPCWNRIRVRRVLSDAYEHCPAAFEIEKMDWVRPCTLEVLPDKLLRHRMQPIVFKLAVQSCGQYDNEGGGGGGGVEADTDIACLRLICRMTDAERAIHSDFVDSHVGALHALVVASEWDPMLRLSVRDMLPTVPLSLFSTCVELLASMILAGDVRGLLAVYALPAERLAFFQAPLCHRVLSASDIYSDELRPSLALSIMARLPLDLLRPVACALVHPEDTRGKGAAAAAFAVTATIAAMSLEDRLFVVRHLPCKALLGPEDVRALAESYLHHERMVVSQLVMEVVVVTQHMGVCEKYAGWSMEVLKRGPTKHVRELAYKMLLCVSGPVLLKELQAGGLDGVQGYFVCKLLDQLDSGFLPAFLEDILRVCEGNVYAQLPMEVLARMPPATLFEHRHRVLAVVDKRGQECGVRWDASRKVLRALAIAGATLAKDMLWEQRYAYIMAT